LPPGIKQNEQQQFQFGDFKQGELQSSPPAAPPAPQTQTVSRPAVPAAPPVAPARPVPAPPSEGKPSTVSDATMSGSAGPKGSGGLHPPAGGHHQQQRSFSAGSRGPRNPPHQPVPVAPSFQQAAMYTMQFPINMAAYTYTGTPYAPAGGGYPAAATQYGAPYYPAQQTATVATGMPRAPPQVSLPPQPPTASSPYSTAPTSPLPPKPAPTQGALPKPAPRKILKIENPDTHEVLDLEHVREERQEKEKQATATFEKEASVPPSVPPAPPAAAQVLIPPSTAPAAAIGRAMPPVEHETDRDATAAHVAKPAGAWGGSKSFKDIIQQVPKAEEVPKPAAAAPPAAAEAPVQTKAAPPARPEQQPAEVCYFFFSGPFLCHFLVSCSNAIMKFDDSAAYKPACRPELAEHWSGRDSSLRITNSVACLAGCAFSPCVSVLNCWQTSLCIAGSNNNGSASG
jgi:hypothetical protein